MAQTTRKDAVYRKDEAEEIYLYDPTPPNADAVNLGFMYPASYQIALSSLGYLILFKGMDQDPMVNVSRVYMDTLSDYDPRQFELMGFSFSFELDVVAILKTFETYKIPFFSKDRERSHPLIFAGGPVPMSNPEPFADFFDFFLIGEGEEMMGELTRSYKKHEHLSDREELIRRIAAEVPGLYVPNLYNVEYEDNNGPIKSITPKYDDIPPVVQKRLIENMDNFVASSPIISDKAIFANKFLVEVMRGCAHRCRFCLASYSMLPARGPSAERIIQTIDQGLQHTDKLGLLGALISNHPNFDDICAHLHKKLDANPDLNISASSLRVDTITEDIVRTFVRGHQKQLTVAIETGSEKLRRRINKNLPHEKIIQCAETAKAGGLKSLKFYGMVALPDETPEDIDETVALMKEVKKAAPGLEIILGSSSFVPKGGTPFQWMSRPDNKEVDARFKRLKKGLIKTCDVRATSAKWDFFQAFLSRGDRRLSKLLVRFYEHGGSLGHINRAMKELKAEGKLDFPELDWYALRERPESEVLPWDTINLGVPRDILYKESLPSAGYLKEYYSEKVPTA